MKRSIALFIACMVMGAIAAYAQPKGRMSTPDRNVQYRFIKHTEGTRKVMAGDVLYLHFRMAAEKTDSVIIETFSSNQVRYIPASEPVMGQVMMKFAKGDSVELWVNADTLFEKSFGMAKPDFFKPFEKVHFIIKVEDILNQKEMLKKEAEFVNEKKLKDSLEFAAYIATLPEVQQTASGLRYVVMKKTEGKQAKSGDKVSMMYEGRLLNGQVFDGNMDGTRPTFDFTIGQGQVIAGWDEAIALMKEGEEFQIIIPWKLAYGDRGTGPIPPYSSLVFDVKLVKIN
jgi:FKBP-type peptidyl-prolyl cis-trans isomerase